MPCDVKVIERWLYVRWNPVPFQKDKMAGASHFVQVYRSFSSTAKCIRSSGVWNKREAVILSVGEE